jgi:putative transposase
MARKLRLEYPGAIYHVMNRGNRRDVIFLDNQDRYSFLETLSAACQRTGWKIHAYCLMPNHFHLVVETPSPNLVAGMKWLLGTYTIRFNRRRNLVGHLFAGRYKASPVDGSGNGYLKSVCDYVHLNPVRANLLTPTQPLTAYTWSSYPDYLKPPTRRWKHLDVNRLFGEHGIRGDTSAGRAHFGRCMDLRRKEDNTAAWQELRHAWAVGDESFLKDLFQRANAVTNKNAIPTIQTAEDQAAQIIAAELKRRRIRPTDLAKLPKSHSAKIAIAKMVRAETTVSIPWLSSQLHTGVPGYLACLLHRDRKNNKIMD